ncbi:MAG TPA: cytochrome P450 [Acidimicrobiales bacterium]|jgi:cytochrome P450
MKALADEFQPFDVAEPFAFYQRARSEATAFYSPELDYWVVPRYEDVLAILRDPATFSSENAQSPFRPRPPAVERILGSGLSVKSGLLGRNPPDHTRLRSFVNKAFTPRRVAVLEPQIREIAVRMIERMAPLGRGDWVADLAYDLPALVIFLLLGIPDSDVPNVKAWAQSRVQLNFGSLPEADQVPHAENVVAYWRYCEALVEERFTEPADDLPSDLVREYQRGDRSITKDEIAGLVFGQLTAGHETTTGLLATGFLQLLRNPEQWRALCRDPDLIPTAVEELLRFCTPVLAVKRKVRHAATVGDADLPAGANVLLLLGSANHDEVAFPGGDGLDVCRPSVGRHLAFGHGIHFCLGAPLARLEAQVVLRELTARLPHARLVEPQDVPFSRNTTFRSPLRLLVEWDS